MDRREELRKLLEERGVEGITYLTEDFSDEEIEGAIATVAYCDEQPKAGTGLLVWLLKKGGVAGYRKPKDRQKAEVTSSSAISETLLRAVRGSCRSPNGFTREEARGTFGAKADRMGISVDSLIDAAMGDEWQETPTHEALSKDGTPEERLARYERWLSEAAP